MPEDKSDQISLIWKVIGEARKESPVVDYALALAALAACASLILYFLGDKNVAIIAVALVFVGAILVFVFSTLLKAKSRLISAMGGVLLSAVVLFFVAFLGFTTSAVAFSWPCNWARFIGIDANCDTLKLSSCDAMENKAARLIQDRAFCAEGRDVASQLTKQCPNHSAGYHVLASAQYCLSDLESSVLNWEEALKIDSNNRIYKRNIGAAYIRMKEYNKAKDIYEKLSLEESNNGKTYASTQYNYAMSLLLSGNLKDSNSIFEKLKDISTYKIRSKVGILLYKAIISGCMLTEDDKIRFKQLLDLDPKIGVLIGNERLENDLANEYEPYLWVLEEKCDDSSRIF